VTKTDFFHTFYTLNQFIICFTLVDGAITEYNNKNNQKTSGEIQKNILPIVG
jgi:hypothetical protein